MALNTPDAKLPMVSLLSNGKPGAAWQPCVCPAPHPTLPLMSDYLLPMVTAMVSGTTSTLKVCPSLPSTWQITGSW